MRAPLVVCNTAKVRFFKQITTVRLSISKMIRLFAIQQKYDFSSKSQLIVLLTCLTLSCLQYSKSTIFQANHNPTWPCRRCQGVVCNTAKVRFFKQITTLLTWFRMTMLLFAIQQKYDFSSKSQQLGRDGGVLHVVCNTAKVRFFKQITTRKNSLQPWPTLFAIQQKYDFSSKSQRMRSRTSFGMRCLQYSKSTIFQANHNKGCR